MTEGSPRRNAPADWVRGRGWRLAQNAALVVAALLGCNAARILNEGRPNAVSYAQYFDEAAIWLGLALLALVFAALPSRRPAFAFRTWPSRALSFAERHWVEILLVTGILLFGVFMRLYRFQSSLPMPEGICCEEGINGGVAYKALLGERPLNFLITRWGSAFGFLIFGETSLGLRFFFPVMSIITLFAFYFFLRKLVSVPAALFGFALLAAAWWPSLRARQASEGTIYAVLFALALTYTLRTKSSVWALATGVFAGLMSYEYEPYKAVPIIAGLFLICATGREIALRSPYTIAGARDRARSLVRIAFRPLLVGLMACGLVLVPMIVGIHQGGDLYLTSVHRNEAGREGERFAENWRTQLKWATQIFLPFGPNEYEGSPPRDIEGTDLLDPVAGWLALAGFITAALLLLRGMRGFFVMWTVITLGAAAVLLHNFEPWKFLVLVPVMITFAALFADDLRTLASRRWGTRGAGGLAAILVLAAAFSMWWNADALFNDIGPSDTVQASYGTEASLLYSVCSDLRDGDDPYAYVASTVPSLALGLAALRETEEAEGYAWGDMVWACHGLRGAPVPAAEELWPLRSVPTGPVALVATNPAAADEVMRLLAAVYPELPPPTLTTGPGNRFTYLHYDVSSGSVLAQSGLWGTYSAAPNTAAGVAGVPSPESRVDDLTDLSWDETPPPIDAPFRAHWQGLVYLSEPTNAALVANAEQPATVLLDGEQVFSGSQGQGTIAPIDLVPGWHTVEVEMTQPTNGGSVSLAWSTRLPLNRGDLFPLRDLAGWIQTRTVGLPGGVVEEKTQRLDAAPHYVSTETIALLSQQSGFKRQLSDISWHGVWHIDDAGDYGLQVEFRSGQTTLLIDGQQVAQSEEFDQTQNTLNVALTLQPGPHTIELIQSVNASAATAGAAVSAFRAGQPFEMRVTPY